MTFSQILNKRMEYFCRSEPKGIYSLYSEKSKLKEFFPTAESYAEHFAKIEIEQTPIGIEVFRETTEQDSIGEALYIEIFRKGSSAVKFYSKTTFIKENDTWKILDDKREEQYIKD